MLSLVKLYHWAPPSITLSYTHHTISATNSSGHTQLNQRECQLNSTLTHEHIMTLSWLKLLPGYLWYTNEYHKYHYSRHNLRIAEIYTCLVCKDCFWENCPCSYTLVPTITLWNHSGCTLCGVCCECQRNVLKRGALALARDGQVCYDMITPVSCQQLPQLSKYKKNHSMTSWLLQVLALCA